MGDVKQQIADFLRENSMDEAADMVLYDFPALGGDASAEVERLKASLRIQDAACIDLERERDEAYRRGVEDALRYDMVSPLEAADAIRALLDKEVQP